jgi:agmatine deiminase
MPTWSRLAVQRRYINVNDEAVKSGPHTAAQAGRKATSVFMVPTNTLVSRSRCGDLRHKHPVETKQPLLAVDWDYNAWGNKYPPYDLDNLIPARMAKVLGMPSVKGGMVLEGGSIDCNGDGVLLTSESCLLNPNRNPKLTATRSNEADRHGSREVLWLGTASPETTPTAASMT